AAANARAVACHRFDGGFFEGKVAGDFESVRAEDGADAGRAATEGGGAKRIGSTPAGIGGILDGESRLREIAGRGLKMNGQRRVQITLHVRKASLTGCAVAALMAMLLGCADDKTVEKPKTPVRLTPVSLGGAGGIRYSANVTANTQVTLAFKSGGYVE